MAGTEIIAVADILEDLHKEFKFQFSPGTIYPLMHSLERKGYVQRAHRNSRNYYFLTEKGKMMLEKLQDNVEDFQKILSHLLKRQQNSLDTFDI